VAIAANKSFGHYHVLAPLGAGGMGEVWCARDTRLNRQVAIKVLPASFTNDAHRLRRFEQEAKAASALNHPNIITIYEIGEAATEGGDIHFMATELIEGQTVRQQIACARLKLGSALDVATQVASALAAAHAAGIVHRDIKPENVMSRPDGLVNVLDFGLAKLTERRAPAFDTEGPTAINVKTDAGVVMGTAQYMSPEQARGVEADARTDIFSLGVMLYEMIAGRLPFEGKTTADVFVSILEKEPAPLTRHAPEVPAELQRIISKALRKDREERYQGVKDLLLDLKSLKEELIYEAKSRAARQPETADGATGATSLNQGLETAKVMGAPSAEISPARTTSSAEYLVSGIIRHKLGAIIALVVLVMASAALYSFYPRSNQSIESLAVLPFANVGADPNTEYLADGIPESIINSLSQLSKLHVLARSTTFKFKGRDMDPQKVGHDLGVQAVFTGRVLQRGDTLEVHAELIDVTTGSQLWGQQYNRELADVFAVQEEIAKEISERLRVRLNGAERQQLAKRPTENLKAFQYYTLAQNYIKRRTREDLLTAISYCEKAIAEDHNYALAYTGLSEAYGSLGVRGYIAPSEGRLKQEDNARKALLLDANLAEAHVALGHTYTEFAPHNFSLGDREVRHAIELSPSLALAHEHLAFSLLRQGRFDEGLDESLKARELDPLSSVNARGMSFCYYLKRDYAQAIELLRQSNKLGPAYTYSIEIGMYIQNGLFDEALAGLEQAKRERKNDPILIHSTGMVYAARGERAEALRIIKELEEMSGANLSEAILIAKIYAALNEKDLALTWMERGLATGALAGAFYKDEPAWDTIRSDPRFADLLRRMGIPS
jgi:eukaryotic-like serine/threonine-protein kinase